MPAIFQLKFARVRAVQLRWDTWSEMCEHAGVGKLADGKPEGCYIDPETGSASPTPVGTDHQIGLCIPTPLGLVVARQGEWIIRGPRGELYLCGDVVFRALYEPVANPGREDVVI